MIIIELMLMKVQIWSIIVTISTGTAKVERTWIICIKIMGEMVPQSCFDLTFDDGN